MKDFQQRKKIRKVLYSRNVVIALAIVTVLLLRGALGVLQKDVESKKNLAITEQQLSQAQARNEELTKSIEVLNTDAGVENEIREKFNVSKVGEQVAIIVEPKISTSTKTKSSGGFWSSVLGWFKKTF